MRVIILHHIPWTLKKNACFGIIVGCLAALSLGVWVIGEAPTNNAVANNSSNKSKRLIITCLVHATAVAILIDELVHFIVHIHDPDLVDLLHTMTVLVAGLPSFYYILTALELMSSIDRARRETKEMEKLWGKTAPLLSSADGAVFKVAPNTADFVTFLADGSFIFMILTLNIDVVSAVVADAKVHTFRIINGIIFLGSLSICGATNALTSRFFKYCIDGFLQMVKGGKKVMTASTNTKDNGKTVPPAIRPIADSEEIDNHQIELSARDIARAEKVVGSDHGESISEDEISMSESEILGESAGYLGDEGDDRQHNRKTWIVI